MQRGYFGIGIEGVSKPVNFGNLARTAHGFGASFVFTVAPAREIGKPGSDTNRGDAHLPWYTYPSVAGMHLPDDCRVVGIELTDDAIELPSFRHPTRAAYVLGPESGSLSPEMTECCESVVKIPIRYCINVATAGAIVMYDRMLSLGKFAERLVKSGAPLIPIRQHVHGKPLYSGGIRMPGRKGRNRQPKP